MAKQKIVIKMDGSKEKFDPNKIVLACMNAGAPEDIAKKIASKVARSFKDKIHALEIRNIVLKELRKYNPQWADNWEFWDRIVKKRITIEGGKVIEIEKGNVYLGREVKDVGGKGLDSYEKVLDILSEMEYDLEHGIPASKINARTYVLLMAVLKSKKMKKEDKIKSIEAINDFREAHGWKPFKLERPIE